LGAVIRESRIFVVSGSWWLKNIVVPSQPPVQSWTGKAARR
jgi:hypothetical protein